MMIKEPFSGSPTPSMILIMVVLAHAGVDPLGLQLMKRSETDASGYVLMDLLKTLLFRGWGVNSP